MSRSDSAGRGPTDPECQSDAAYVLGALSPAERSAFELHLATCPRCQTSVAQLAGLPPLLAGTTPGALTDDESPLPATILPNLLAEITVRRRRRRVMIAALAGLAAACVAVLVVVLAVRPTGAPTGSAGSAAQTVQLTSPQHSGMAVTIALTDQSWGTAMTVVCDYRGYAVSGTGYRLVLVTTNGQDVDAGSWASVADARSTVQAATALPRNQIAALQVRLDDGTVIASAPVSN